MKTKKNHEIEFAAVVKLGKTGDKIKAMVIPIFYTLEDGTIKKGNGMAVSDELWNEADLIEVEQATATKYGKFPKITSPEFQDWIKKCQAV